jgi:hypothetical protein
LQSKARLWKWCPCSVLQRYSSKIKQQRSDNEHRRQLGFFSTKIPSISTQFLSTNQGIPCALWFHHLMNNAHKLFVFITHSKNPLLLLFTPLLIWWCLLFQGNKTEIVISSYEDHFMVSECFASCVFIETLLKFLTTFRLLPLK